MNNCDDNQIEKISPQNKQYLVTVFQSLLNSVDKDEIRDFQVSTDKNKTQIIIDDSDGKRTVLQQMNFPGLSQHTMIESKKMPREQRIETVWQLKEQHKTQQEIAILLNISQKTVSNDLKRKSASGKTISSLKNRKEENHK